MQQEKEKTQDHQIENRAKLVKIDLPFVRVYPIASLHFEPTQKIVTVARTDSSLEFWSYPSWSLLSRVHLDLNLVIKKAVYAVLSEGHFVVVTTANGYLLIYDVSKGEISQSVQHGGDFAWDSATFKFQFLEDEKNAIEEEEGTEMMVAVACEDGAARLFKITSRGRIVLSGGSGQQGSECTSVCFSSDGGYYYAGYADCTVRKFTVRGGRTALTISTGQASKDERIWSLGVVDPQYLAVGYSTGKVRFFETTFGTLIREFAEHSGDILSLLVSRDHKRIYASGADSKVVCFNKVVEEQEGGFERLDFQSGSSDRGQSHDIYALEELHDDLIMTGGLSTDICLHKIRDGNLQDRRLGTPKEIKLRHITYSFQDWQTQVSEKNSLVLTSNSSSVDIFRLDFNKGDSDSSENQEEGAEAMVREGEEDIDYLCRIQKTSTPIEAVAVNKKLGIIAVATRDSLEMLWFQVGDDRVRKIKSPFGALGALALHFSRKRLYSVLEDRTLGIFDIGTRTHSVQNSKNLKKFGKIDIFDIDISENFMLVGDTLNKNLKVINIQKENLVANLSSMQKANFVNARFSPKSSNVVIFYTTNRFIISSSSGKVRFMSSKILPASLGGRYNRYYSGVFSSSQKGKMIIHSKYSFYKIDVSDSSKYEDLLKRTEDSFYKNGDGSLKSKPESTNQDQLTVYTADKPIVGLKELGSDSFALVSYNWKSAMSDIPDPVISKKFIK